MAIVSLLLLTSLVCVNRSVFDSWIVRHDILTQYLPWYSYLGRELRSFNIPGWNPFQFSGTPFAGDPQSGWMYLPVMIPFTFFEPVTAFKVTVMLELLIAGLGTYALGRVIGLRPLASLLAAVVFQFGPLLYYATYCCTVRIQLALWIPVALLGIELGTRASGWHSKLPSYCLTAFALSQMVSGWLGQGSLNGFLVVFSYLVYRTILSPPLSTSSLRTRFLNAGVAGAIFGGLSISLSAAGLFPRISVNPETNLAGGNYDGIGSGYTVGPYTLKELVGFLIADDFTHRELTLGSIAIILAVLAPFLARRQFAVPYFTGLTLVVLILSLPTNLVHYPFFLVPRWRELHEHNVPHVTAVLGIGPAMLAGATIESLSSWRGRIRHRSLLFVPLALIIGAAIWTWDDETRIGWSAISAAAIGTILVVVSVSVDPRNVLGRLLAASSARVVAILTIAVAFLQPTGLELIDATSGTSLIAGWETIWDQPADRATGETINISTTDQDGAGAFLQERLLTDGPFRYFGYGGLGFEGDRDRAKNYTLRRFNPNVQAILVNGRSIFLGIFDIQGYNPVQLRRYVDFIALVNGKTQDYHHANIRPSGVDSRLLDLLNVRYVLLDASIPADRDDIVALTANRHEVFRNDLVVIYERDTPLLPVWIVHNVVDTPNRDTARDRIAEPDFDPFQFAVVEGKTRNLDPPLDGATEAAVVTKYEPDQIVVRTSSSTNGYLVFSEVLANGWVVTIDGESTPIYPTDFILRGIELPAGDHEIIMSYKPDALRLGLLVSGAASLLIVVVLCWSAIKALSLHRVTPGASTVDTNADPAPS